MSLSVLVAGVVRSWMNMTRLLRTGADRADEIAKTQISAMWLGRLQRRSFPWRRRQSIDENAVAVVLSMMVTGLSMMMPLSRHLLTSVGENAAVIATTMTLLARRCL